MAPAPQPTQAGSEPTTLGKRRRQALCCRDTVLLTSTCSVTVLLEVFVVVVRDRGYCGRRRCDGRTFESRRLKPALAPGVGNPTCEPLPMLHVAHTAGFEAADDISALERDEVAQRNIGCDLRGDTREFARRQQVGHRTEHFCIPAQDTWDTFAMHALFTHAQGCYFSGGF